MKYPYGNSRSISCILYFCILYLFDKPIFEIPPPTGIEKRITMKILAIGDVVGRRAIEYLSDKLRKTVSSLRADLVVCNGENAMMRAVSCTMIPILV